MNVTAILLSAGVMVVLGVLFGVILTIADKKFKVEVDPRVEAVRACLGGANCGACGYAGCDAFADAVVAGKAPVNGCSPSGANGRFCRSRGAQGRPCHLPGRLRRSKGAL